MRQLQDNQKVFGIGLSKTGTTSLTKALNILGIKSIHFPHDEQTFAELKRGDFQLSILAEYQGVTDTPVAPFFAQLDEAWPGSKFVLTVRDKASWLRSADTHWLHMGEGRPGRDLAFRAFVDFINARVYGRTDFSAERFSDVYDAHVRQATDYFADRPEDFLALDICGGGGGWEELCGFLGVPIPQSISFPHEHRAQQWSHMVRAAGKELADVVPAGETVIVIDEQALGGNFAEGRRRLPFLERNGEYWGVPADDDSAIAELERQRSEGGANFVAVAWPAFWWLNHFAQFTAHLQSTYDCVMRNDRLVVWALR